MKHLYKLYPYLVKYKRYIIFGFLFILLSNVFAIVIPPLVRESINGIKLLLETGEKPYFYGFFVAYFTSPSRIALVFGMLIVASALLKGILMFFMRQTIIVMSRYVEYDLKNNIYRHYQSLDQSFYQKNYTGDLMNRISEDVSRVRDFVGPAIMYSINLTCLMSMVIGVMLSVNPFITWKVLLPLPILAFTIYKVSSTMNKRSDLIQKKLSGLTSYVQETFSGVQVVKSFGVEDLFTDDFEKNTLEYKEKNMSLVNVNALFFPIVLGIVGLSILITVYFGGKAAIEGQFTIGNIAEFVIYVNMLTWPVAALGYITSLVQRASASMARINEFMDTKSELNTGTIEISSLAQSIEFKDVYFKYPNTEKYVLEGVSFTVRANSKLGIIGTTGSGKSTLAKLMLGIYPITKGAILIDGEPIQNYEKTKLRKLFGYVGQDIFLFSDTIKNNIAFGVTDPAQEKNLAEVVKMTQLESELKSFPEGINTIVGERGITISGGQKQRVAIARALLKKPDILLIDDGLSAVDTKTEVAIKKGLDRFSSQSTFINISHRISSISDSDNILFLDHGRIIEQGSHQQLMAKNGVYAELYKGQLMNEEAPLGD